MKNLKSQLKNKLRRYNHHYLQLLYLQNSTLFSLFLNQLIDYFNPDINSIQGLCR